MCCTEGITKPAIRKLARKGGVKRISGLIYEETRGVLKGACHRLPLPVTLSHTRSLTYDALLWVSPRQCSSRMCFATPSATRSACYALRHPHCRLH